MTTDRINHLNIGLMIASAAAAFVLPFELFLFSYAVLGPLHYLTEISWLKDRKFFCNLKWDWLPIVALCVLYFLGSESVLGEYHITLLATHAGDLVLMTFGLALIFVLTKSLKARLLGTMAMLIVTFLLHNPEQNLRNIPLLILLIFIPTLIHVFVFTAAFILFGALKSKSISGYVSFGVLLLCAGSFLVIKPDTSGYVVSDYVRQSYALFEQLNAIILSLLGIRLHHGEDSFSHPANVALTRFIGFAYTYHYLNWFSKTSIIRWHEVSWPRMAVVVAIWLVSVGLYAWDYALGFKWLLFLSMAHVMLEFPLNHRSFIGIGQELWGRVSHAISVVIRQRTSAER